MDMDAGSNPYPIFHHKATIKLKPADERAKLVASHEAVFLTPQNEYKLRSKCLEFCLKTNGSTWVLNLLYIRIELLPRLEPQASLFRVTRRYQNS